MNSNYPKAITPGFVINNATEAEAQLRCINTVRLLPGSALLFSNVATFIWWRVQTNEPCKTPVGSVQIHLWCFCTPIIDWWKLTSMVQRAALHRATSGTVWCTSPHSLWAQLYWSRCMRGPYSPLGCSGACHSWLAQCQNWLRLYAEPKIVPGAALHLKNIMSKQF